jgi:tetratricopeptide (TPR) repeat protein
MLMYGITQRAPKAIAYGRRSLAIARTFNLRDQTALTLNDLARATLSAGDLEQALAYGRDAIALFRELGNLPMLADSLGTAAGVLFFCGDFPQLLAYSSEALQISRSIGNLWGEAFSQLWLGSVYAEQGDCGRGIATFHECRQLAAQAGFVLGKAIVDVQLALLYSDIGAPATAMQIAREGMADPSAQVTIFGPMLVMMLAQAQLIHGNVDEAEATFDTIRDEQTQAMIMSAVQLPFESELALARHAYAAAIAAADSYVARQRAKGLRWCLARALWVKGSALLSLGDATAAREAFVEARHEAEALGSRRMGWRVLLGLAASETQLGNSAAAGEFLGQARETFRYIADHIPDPQLRAGFLALPAVRAASAE